MSQFQKDILVAKLLVCQRTLKSLLSELVDIGEDNESAMYKFAKIKMIREEINKVGMEIDNIKQEVMLLDKRNIN